MEIFSAVEKKIPREVLTGNTNPVRPVEKKNEKKKKDEDEENSFETKLWCFTSYNENPFMFDYEVCEYLGYERETCPKSGRLHWQGFVYLNDRVSLKKIDKVLIQLHPVEKEIYKPVHREPMRGSFKQNVKYCSKDGNFVEFGEKPSQGQRVDLLLLRDEINQGTSVKKIRQRTPVKYHQYGRTLDKLADDLLIDDERDFMTKGIWYWGPSGKGKSKKSREGLPQNMRYSYPNDGGWWDLYKQQDTVIIDDYDGVEIPFKQLLKMVDRYDYQVKRRNLPPIQFRSKTVIITCSKHPDDLFSKLDENMNQIYRRFEIVEFKHE